MITEWEVYWITRCDGIEIFLGITACFVGVAYAVLLGATLFHAIFQNASDFDDDDKVRYKSLKHYSKILLIPCFLYISAAILMPDTKEMCAIKVIPLVVNQEDIQEIPANIADLANEWIEELKPNKD